MANKREKTTAEIIGEIMKDKSETIIREERANIDRENARDLTEIAADSIGLDVSQFAELEDDVKTKKIKEALTNLRKEALNKNKAVFFTIQDKNGKRTLMEIVPEAIDDPEHNTPKKKGDIGFEDNDRLVNTYETKDGYRKQITKKDFKQKALSASTKIGKTLANHGLRKGKELAHKIEGEIASSIRTAVGEMGH